ncbi:MAG: hypothetical protein LAO18_20645 [Acidobacteriia bacterium]|nr:hypothetical protein [Terriglobia bacterium]
MSPAEPAFWRSREFSQPPLTAGTIEISITAGDGAESLEEFHALLEDLGDAYDPVGVVEEILVQTIATTLWRKARVIRAENGEIRKQLDTAAADRALPNSDKGNFDLAISEMELRLYNAENPTDQKMSTMERLSAAQLAQRTLREHGSGLDYLSVLLRRAKSEIQSQGFISERLRKKIFSTVCFWDYGFALGCLSGGPGRGGPKDSLSETETSNADLLAIIENRLERLGTFKEYSVEREKLAADAEGKALSLPSANAIDKLLRYEAHLDRQLYRAMDQLERLQRQRKGENVLPPLNINLEKRN